MENFEGGKKTFLNHVFSTSEEGKSEIFNSVQYSFLAIIPIVVLNKLIQRFIPEPNNEKGSVEILVEILIQLFVLIVGIIIVHRVITYFPTYSGFKYESLTITNVILAFMIIVLSLQTKIGIKTNILYERIIDLWEGTSSNEKKQLIKKGVRINNNEGMMTQQQQPHAPSQSDHLDNSPQSGIFPPMPRSENNNTKTTDSFAMMSQDPMPANFSGSPFGSSF